MSDPPPAADPLRAAARRAIYPQAFYPAHLPDPYNFPQATLLLEFFHGKTLAVLKAEDRREQWYDDWLAWQAHHHLYASLLSPQRYSRRGTSFDLLRYARFLELFAYASPAHGYSLQVSFLGLFSILMGTNEALKQEAVATLESGGLLGFAVSEQAHGSDLLANECSLRAIPDADPPRYLADGKKYYIGNSNAAALLSILARKVSPADARATPTQRLPFTLFALRPPTPGYRNLRKISTLGVRAAHVGEFEVINHPVAAADIVADGRDAWDAVFGTVTLGKFFLGFGSIGICEHALAEAASHLRTRILYGKPALVMPHLRARMAEATARLLAMKLYAFRALDYLHAASADDRRYQLFCAVQKARVSTQGVRVMALISESVGAKGFEADTYLEMALRDIQLIPGLEGSMHINLAFSLQLMPRYLGRWERRDPPPSLVAGETASRENLYLPQARTGAIPAIAFPPFLKAYHPLAHVPNVARFARQARAFRTFARGLSRETLADAHLSLAVAEALAVLVYAQLIAEGADRLQLPRGILSTLFGLLVMDLGAAALTLAALPQLPAAARDLLPAIVRHPLTSVDDWHAIDDLIP